MTFRFVSFYLTIPFGWSSRVSRHFIPNHHAADVRRARRPPIVRTFGVPFSTPHRPLLGRRRLGFGPPVGPGSDFSHVGPDVAGMMGAKIHFDSMLGHAVFQAQGKKSLR